MAYWWNNKKLLESLLKTGKYSPQGGRIFQWRKKIQSDTIYSRNNHSAALGMKINKKNK